MGVAIRDQRPAPSASRVPGFRADPAQGRVFTTRREVRSTDVIPEGRLRLDALARYLQAAAEDDVSDAGRDGSYVWLLRRMALAIRGYPAHRERISLRTYCSATGPRWAERTTTVSAAGGDLIQSTAIWVAVSARDGRPVPLGESFQRVYGPSAGGWQVSARLSHPGLPGSAAARPWPLRAADFDTAERHGNGPETVFPPQVPRPGGACKWARRPAVRGVPGPRRGRARAACGVRSGGPAGPTRFGLRFTLGVAT